MVNNTNKQLFVVTGLIVDDATGMYHYARPLAVVSSFKQAHELADKINANGLIYDNEVYDEICVHPVDSLLETKDKKRG